MPEVLRDLSGSVLSKVIETNLYALLPFSHNWPQAEVYTGRDISWCITDISFPSCNSVFRAQLNPEDIDSTIKSLILRGRTRNVPLQWWIGQDTTPSNLGEYLIAHGFTRFGDGAGMAIDLLAMKEYILAPSALTIMHVNDIENLKTWCHVSAIGFGMPAVAESALFKWFTTCIDLKLPLKFYLGWYDREPVSTSLLFLAEGVAGIYFVATIPEARRRGIGFAITLKALQEARDMEYRVGILQASKMGEPVYRKIGFQEYCKISSYIWLNEPQKPLLDKRP
jgi:GNAT superfamily N-acetyltransferase